MQKTTKTLTILTGALAIVSGALIAATAIGKSVGSGVNAPVVAAPLVRDQFGVAILEREPSPREESEFLRKAKLRADLRDAIVVR